MRLKTLGLTVSALAVSALALVASAGLAETPTGLDGRGHMEEVANVNAAGFDLVRLKNGVQFRVGGMTKSVIFYSPTTVRVNTNLGENYWTQPSIVVTDTPDDIDFKISRSGRTASIRSDRLQIDVDTVTGALTFKGPDGHVFTHEDAAHPQTVEKKTISDAPTYEVSNSFTLKPDEGIYGFGFVDQGNLNRRNKDLLLVQTNVGIVIPVMVSSEKYGILWDTYSQMRFKDDAGKATLWAESAPGGVDYYFMAGNSLDEVVADYRGLTGDAPMFPKQAFGLFMSKERYPDQKRLVEVAKTFRKEQFPLDYIVQDWQYWGSDTDGTWSGMIWNPERYPDPEGMTREIHDLHMKLMVSIWPSIGNDTELAHELDAHDLRFTPLHWISKKARVYDAYSPLGRQIYFKYIKKGLLDKGVDALWMDGTEVEVGSAAWDAQENIRDIKGLGLNAMGDFTRYLNPYSLMTTQGTYDGERATSDQRVFTLTRSAWAGAQRTAAASWSGDIFANWKTFREQISGGVNVTVTGNPYWTQDTGGFFVNEFPGGERNPAYQELFARWFQFAAFNPIMRVHGTSIEREPYIFKDLNPEMYQSLLDTVHLRYRLLPYIYSEAWQVTANRSTLMRALPMDFPDDKVTHDVDDAFMFGPSFLVHPVTRAMYHVQDPPAETIPASALHTADGKAGLAGQYFAGVNFDTPKGKVVDATLDARWPGPPLAEIPAGLESLNNFSARWEGFVTAPEEGTYEIGLEGDDGYRLFLDGKLIVEDWSQGAKRYKGATVTLHKGQQVAVKIEYFQGGGERSLRLAWRTPSDLRALKQNTPAIDTRVETYLPKGANWYDFWTNAAFKGGQTASMDAPLDRFPLYVRAGSIVPMGPVVQYATENPGAPYELRIYPGADASFTLYEDDNETYAYEKGARATVDIHWDDKARSLVFGKRQGTFPGLVQSRTFNVVVAKPGNANGITEAQPIKTISYMGENLELKLAD